MSVATITSEPVRHALVAPDCDCGTCAPTWARRRGRSQRYARPVTLMDALEAEDAACRPGMVQEHRESLAAMVAAVGAASTAAPWDIPGRSGMGLALVLFAGELASAVGTEELRAELPQGLVTGCEQTVTEATLAAAGCLAGLVGVLELLSQSMSRWTELVD